MSQQFPTGRLAKLGIIGGMGLVGVLILNPFTVIPAGQRGVVLNFGKVENTVLGEGLHLKWPLITQIKTIDVRVRKTDIGVPAGTKDLQIIKTSLSLNWHIDPTKVNRIFQQIGDEKTITSTVIIPALTEVLKAATPKRNAEEILQRRDLLKAEIDQAIAQRLQEYGVIIDDVSLVNIEFSPEFSKSIEEKQIAEQDAKRAAYLAQKAENEALAEVNLAKGKAEAQRLLKASLTPELIQQQAVTKWNGQLPSIMTGENTLPFLNLPAGSSK
jgi:regulator of protease activity HflC (stomatin/prohibitin superfamily)